MPNGKPSQYTQFLSAKESLLKWPGLQLSQVLDVEEIIDAAQALGIRYRTRIFSPWVTLWTFLWQVISPDHSCREALMRLHSDQFACGSQLCNTDTGAYCRARMRLSYGLIVMLFRRVAQRLHDRLADGALLWCGRRVKIVDGSTVSMPDTAANQARFPQQSGQKAGLGFPIARLVAIFCWASGAILEVATCPFQGKENSELALFRGLLGTLSPKEVVLGDRFYASYLMLALLQHQDVDAVFRQHQARKVDFRRGRRLGRGEHVVVWHKPKRPAWMEQETYDELPGTLTLREIRIGRLVLVTTLLDSALFTREAIGALYQSRWHAELDLRCIKQVMAMDVLRCLTPDMVLKEIAVHLLAYNLIRALMCKAAQHYELLPRTLSFKACLQFLLSHRGSFGHRSFDALEVRSFLVVLITHRVADRPNRKEPRAVKRRPKPYPLLTKPRAQARAELRSR